MNTYTIKNMVCRRCIAAVESIFNDTGVTPTLVRLGEVVTEKPLTDDQNTLLKEKLSEAGFELLDDIRKQQIEKMKALIIDHIHHKEEGKFNFTDVLSRELNREYSSLSKLFSETEGITIEQFVILQKIEKVKELLVYDEYSLGEIADKLGYSSVAHLSGQFKKITGFTPTQFKVQGLGSRKHLDHL